ncbi:NAD(P)-binding protein [Arthrobacter sp. UYCu712]|uniref:NAD(P)-binding protein n=1 Tax=Arthrobacter sp. UYCu712 TaxID=3156340 RepID=UPI00339846D6
MIGAGQAGLAAGYHLAARGLRFEILDSADRVGDVWRHRWDSLRLFTTAQHDGLPGLPFPAARNTFPAKEEFAAYLDSYAARFPAARADRHTRGPGDCGGRRLRGAHPRRAQGRSEFPQTWSAPDPDLLEGPRPRRGGPGAAHDRNPGRPAGAGRRHHRQCPDCCLGHGLPPRGRLDRRTGAAAVGLAGNAAGHRPGMPGLYFLGMPFQYASLRA